MHDVFFTRFWHALSTQFPYIAAYGIGIAIALFCWRRFPLPSLCVFLACCLKMTVAVAFPATIAFMTVQHDFSAFASVETAFTVIDASAYLLLFLAVYRGRTVVPRQYYLPEDWDDDAAPPPDAKP